MMMREVPFSRVEELHFGVPCETRPALTVGNPSMPFVDLGHVTLANASIRHLLRPAKGVSVCSCPRFHRRYDPSLPLSIRFQNVARATAGGERSRVQLCGRLSVEIDGEQLAQALRGRQVPLLLAYLVLNRDRHVGREELIGALWPYRAPVSQDGALRTLLSRLRSALGADVLEGRDELTLELPTPVWIDVEAARVEIERARDALARGEARRAWALAQAPLNIASRGLLPGAQASWLEPRRRDLADIRLQALEVIGRAGLRLGRTQLASVERAAQSLIEAEPYRESGYVLLMEALAAEGNIAEGLRVFERLRVLLRDELGTMPSPETIAAHERMLRPTQTADLDGAARTGAERSELELPAELSSRAAGPLVGRWRELDRLGRLWSRARAGVRDGSGRLVLLTGEPGIGKTRLAAELATNAHRAGAIVLAGRSPEENVVPYQPFLEAIRHYVVGVPSAQLRATARDYGAELARLVPELRRRAPELPAPTRDEPETERYRLFEAVVGLLTEISAYAPVLLVIDDLQWADRATLMLLRHLARAPEPARMLILGAYRDTEHEPGGFADAVAELRRERLVVELDVGGLSESETAQLARLRAGGNPSQAFVRALFRRTEGNPFFIEEIVRHLSEAGLMLDRAGASALDQVTLPEGVKDVIARRLSRLDARAIEWLRVAAVIGRDFDAELLERVASLDEDEFLNALEEVLAAGLVIESPIEPGHYSFSHALIRETLYGGMSAPRRARLHRRVGEALEASGGERHLSALALHFTRAAGAQDAEKAIRYALRAGARASEMLAHEAAAEHYARALEVLRRFDPDDDARRLELLLALGEARVRAGEMPLAWESFREAAGLAERLGDSDALARAAIGASRRYVQQPGVVDHELIDMFWRAYERTADQRTAMRVRLVSRMCGALYYSPERGRMAALSQEALEIAAELDDPEASAFACAARRRALWDPIHLQERLAASTEMLTMARRAGNLELELQAHAWLVVDLLEQGNHDAVDAQIAAFTAGAERLRQPLYLWHAAVWRVMGTLLAGRLDEAGELAADAVASGAPSEAVTAPQYYAIQMLAIRREQDRIGELEPAARQMVASNPVRPAWRAGLADLLLESGRHDEARAELDRLVAGDFQDIPQDGDWMTAIMLLSDVSAGLRDQRCAGLLYELLLPYGATNVVIGLATVCLGSAARYLGKLAATVGRESQAVEHFERALAANQALRAPVCLAHTQLDYAEAIGPATARGASLLDQADRVAVELGLPWVARRAAELRTR
jgi:DNA-binding SARP family transcriptional activator